MFEPDDIAELFKGSVPYYLLIILSLFIIISPVPITGSHEFPVYRMHQYDLHSVPHGSRSSSVNLEARTLNNWETSRHCIVAKLEELTSDSIRQIRSKAGGLLVILPYQDDPISEEKREQIHEIESTMLGQEFPIPVYFVARTKSLESILNDVTNSFTTKDKSTSALQVILSTVSANGYQVVMNPGQPIQKTDILIATLQGKLSGNGVESKLPTIGIVAYYDSNSIAPELSFGADSNGSGVVILLELMRIFSQLYANSKMHAKFNIVFLLTGGGKLNYQGSKKWLEDQLDGLESSIIQDSLFVMCLDSVASGNSLYMHVSKPPKEGSASAEFFKFLKASVIELRPHLLVEGVHKKINLADEHLAWEHERFSIRRLPAFTLSSFKSHRTIRGSLIDSKELMNLDLLEDKTLVIAEALGRLVYNVSVGDVFPEHLGVERDSLKASMDFIAGQPRANQLHSDKNSHLVNSLKDIMSRFLSDVKITYLTPDKRDPEFALYDITHAKLFVYSVKPAVFDLFLTFAIAIYLGIFYLAVQNFPYLYTFMCKFSQPTKAKKQ